MQLADSIINLILQILRRFHADAECNYFYPLRLVAGSTRPQHVVVSYTPLIHHLFTSYPQVVAC